MKNKKTTRTKKWVLMLCWILIVVASGLVGAAIALRIPAGIRCVFPLLVLIILLIRQIKYTIEDMAREKSKECQDKIIQVLENCEKIITKYEEILSKQKEIVARAQTICDNGLYPLNI